MDLIAPPRWLNSPGINVSGQAFVMRWLELFHPLTIDTYRVRHLNARLAFTELCDVIAEAERNRTDMLNATDVALEAKRLLTEDLVAEALVPQRQHYYPPLMTPLIDNNKAIHPGTRVLAEQLRARFEAHYRNTLLDELRDAIVTDQLDRTLRLTSTLAADLIGEGFDLRHLFWRGQSFTKRPVQDFGPRLDAFLTSFRQPEKQRFTAVFRLAFASDYEAADLPATIGRMAVDHAPPRMIHRAAAEFGKQDPKFRYAFVEVDAFDPYAAVSLGTAELTRALDLLQFVRPRSVVSSPAVGLVDWPATAMIIPTAMELLGPLRIATEEVEVRMRQVSDIGRDNRVAAVTVDRLTAGLHYLRRGLTDGVATGQFTNLWIGIETVAGGTGRTNIATLRQQVSRMVALGYPRRILSDLRANIERLHVGLGNEFDTQVLAEQHRTTALVAQWKWLLNPAFIADVVTPAQIEPLLRHRIAAVGNALATRQAVRASLERNAEDVSWHLQRMYRTRNTIVHGGRSAGELTHLGSHLATYLWAILRVLIGELAQPGGISDIDKVMAKYSWLYEQELRLLQEQAQLQFEALVDPMVLWPAV